eukprot:GAHX01000102.1.p1 GENE.GAHX01000102.1~~GAHX01000102.1.p1  ORF type:complete len:120 (+),score=31.21 GAHX01000102.1:47-406(+)
MYSSNIRKFNETDETKNLREDDFNKHHEDYNEVRDVHIESMNKAVLKLGGANKAISEELDTQDRLVDDMHRNMNIASEEIDYNAMKTKGIDDGGSVGECMTNCTILLLLVGFIIVWKLF